MEVHTFLAGRPCLEEIDGYLDGLRWQIEKLKEPQYPEITAEVLAPLETYRRRMMSGREMPWPSKIERAYFYKQKHKPKRTKRC